MIIASVIKLIFNRNCPINWITSWFMFYINRIHPCKANLYSKAYTAAMFDALDISVLEEFPC